MNVASLGTLMFLAGLFAGAKGYGISKQQEERRKQIDELEKAIKEQSEEISAWLKEREELKERLEKIEPTQTRINNAPQNEEQNSNLSFNSG